MVQNRFFFSFGEIFSFVPSPASISLMNKSWRFVNAPALKPVGSWPPQSEPYAVVGCYSSVTKGTRLFWETLDRNAENPSVLVLHSVPRGGSRWGHGWIVGCGADSTSASG